VYTCLNKLGLEVETCSYICYIDACDSKSLDVFSTYQIMECSEVVNKYIHFIFRNAIPGSHDSTQVAVLYINAGPPTGKYILQHCIGLNIPSL
jgi:hypothetical protein